MKIKILIILIVLIGFLPTSFVFAQLTPPANWPEWLKQEWENNIDDVRKTAEETGTWDFDNDDLPQLLQWATENKIKVINADGGSLTAIPGTNQIWRAFKEIPPHLIKLLEDGTISLINRSCLLNAAYLGVEKDEGKIIKKTAIISMCRTARAPDVAHEFGHIVDLVGIRNEKGNEFSLGKTDEGIRVLREEYDRIFQTSAEYQRMYEDGAFTAPPPGFLTIYSVRAELENFGDHFSAYILGSHYFRQKAAQESLLAEKYEFLKTKIFLGKEYFEEKTVITETKPKETASIEKVSLLKEQIAALQEQIVKLQVQLNEIQKTESKTISTPVATPVQTNVFTKTLQRGMRDDEVKTLQEFLRQFSDIYSEGLVTGYFGTLTEAAVKRFQAKYSIEPIGIVGPKTRQKINEFYIIAKPTTPEEMVKSAVPSSTSTITATPTPTLTPTSTLTPTQALTLKPVETKCSDSTFYYQGKCLTRLFPEEAIKPYKTWEKINSVLSEFGITVVLVDEKEKEITPTELEKEKMRESLAYVTYVIDVVFQGTRTKTFLSRLEEIWFRVSGLGSWLNWGNLIQMTFIKEDQNPDEYMIMFQHEIAHSIDGSFFYAGKENIRDNFRLICWDRDQGIYWAQDKPIINTSCLEKEKSFVPTSMTSYRMFKGTDIWRQQQSSYYSTHDFLEDFAESVVAYMVSPGEFRDLAQKYPKLAEKYELIKTYVFDGKEF